MEEADYYDEFGNYIGPVNESEGERARGGEDYDEEYQEELDNVRYEVDDKELHPQRMDDIATNTRAVVLHEDKKYFPNAMEVYGGRVEVSVQDEDTQPLTEPIIAPVREVKIDRVSSEIPGLKYSLDYQMELLNTAPERCRNVIFAGQLHHGKTSLIDLLVAAAHVNPPARPRINLKSAHRREFLPRYLDSLSLEQERGISLRAKPISLLLPDTSGSAHVFNILDTPGHADFREDVGAGLSLMGDGLVLVVDCVEGVLGETEAVLKSALNLGRPILLILNKLERLWLELKLPPMDAYFKLKHVIDRLNTLAQRQLFAPERRNVIFASAVGGWAFSLGSWCRQMYPMMKDPLGLSRRLWGDVYYSPSGKSFHPQPQSDASKRTFVTFVLEPLYKLYTATLSASDPEFLLASLPFLSSKASKKANVPASIVKLFKKNPKQLLKSVLFSFFKGSPIEGLVDGILEHLPSSVKNERHSMSPSGSESLLMSICKVFPPATMTSNRPESAADIRLLCRLWQGRVRPGQVVYIGAEGGASGLDSEDEGWMEARISEVFIPCTRYNIPCPQGTSAPWVLISGVSLDRVIPYGSIRDAAEVSHDSLVLCRFTPNTAAFLRISLEPMVPSELPRMLHGLRLLGLMYPSLKVRVEESGEHVIFGPGELYLDCVLHDLRLFGAMSSPGALEALTTGLQLRVSDPSVAFTESCQEISRLKCFVDTANGRLRITMLAEPLETGLAEAIEAYGPAGMLPPESELMGRHGWDRLSCRSVMAVAGVGGSVLLDDTFGEVDSELMAACRSSLIQGFQWAVREGPLCEEAIRAVKFRLVSLQLLDGGPSTQLSAAQVVPAARRCCYAAFLTAAPRLLEPVLSVQITAPADSLEAIYTLLARRRGHVLSDTPIPATPLYSLMALLPLLDATGFEVDLRVATQGSALPSSTFSTWQALPGDPLDTSIPASLLEPAPAPALARDCLLKTRRRRGIGEDVRLNKYFDPETLELLN